MSKQRMINTRFWVDPWVQENMNTLDRLLFLYLLTNDQTNLCGIYEISNHKMCFETGIEKETLLRAMFPRLEPKVFREGNWVIMVNFPKHQNTNNPSIIQGIQRELELIPEEIYQKALAHGYPVPKKGGTRGVEGTLNLTKPNLSVSLPREVVEVQEDDENQRKPRIVGKERLAYESMLQWAESERGGKFTNRVVQYAALKRAKSAGLKSTDLKDRWQEMSEDAFWAEKGFDWTHVVASFNRKPV